MMNKKQFTWFQFGFKNKNPYKIRVYLLMGRSKGIEPLNAGATNQCVNHFTNSAIQNYMHLINASSILANILNKINI